MGEAAPVKVIEKEKAEDAGSGRPIVFTILLCLLFLLIGAASMYGILKYSYYALTSGEECTCDCEECNRSDETQDEEEVVTGAFTVSYSYPSEGVPPVRLCFEDVTDLSKEYCFFQASGFSSEIDPDSLANLFNGTGTLPVGDYYAYIVAYWDDKPAEVINLNQCNYAQTEEEIELYCADLAEQFDLAVQNCPGARIFTSESDRNVHYGGDRVVFTIEEGQTLDMGIVGVSPNY